MENGALIFYFTAPVIELLRISVCCFLVMLPHQNKPAHSGVRHTVCIIRTLKVKRSSLKKEWKTFKIILISEVIINTSHNTKCIVSCL